MTGPDQGRRSFAGKLAYLIETVHPPDRGPYSYREIAAGIADHPGAMTAAHVNQLTSGKQPHPRIHYVEALASFFGVPVTYFFDDDAAAQIADQITQLSAWRDTGSPAHRRTSRRAQPPRPQHDHQPDRHPARLRRAAPHDPAAPQAQHQRRRMTPCSPLGSPDRPGQER